MRTGRRRDAKAPAAGPSSPVTGRALGLGFVLPLALLLWNLRWTSHYIVDDAFISFRYAQNLADGFGLVYNVGERVEGYTNFLWTLLLAGGIELGFQPAALSTVLGLLGAVACLGLCYRVSRRLDPERAPTSTWLLASSMIFCGWAMSGLETVFFAAILMAGMDLALRERQHAAVRPWSGIAFGIAGLVRPEAPLFFLFGALIAGDRPLSRRSLVRTAWAALPMVAHMIWRHHYYGTFLPNTFHAKTGDLGVQLGKGATYLGDYWSHTIPIGLLALGALIVAVRCRRIEVLGLLGAVFGFMGYVVLIGGDWMINFRLLATVEPLLFVVVDHGVRRAWAAPSRAVRAALVALGLWLVVNRVTERSRLLGEFDFDYVGWATTAGGSAAWIWNRQAPGPVAVGDIGRLGFQLGRDYRIVDIYGLVSPDISRLPGAYGQKTGPRFIDYVYDQEPQYLVTHAVLDCANPDPAEFAQLAADPRFKLYALGGDFSVPRHFAHFCVYERKDAAPGAAPVRPAAQGRPE